MQMNQSIANNVDSGGRQKPDGGHVTYSNSVRQRDTRETDASSIAYCASLYGEREKTG